MPDQKVRTEGTQVNRREFLWAAGLTTTGVAAAAYGVNRFFQPTAAGAQATPPLPSDVKVVRTVCAPNCVNSCAHNVFVKDDRVLKIEPGPFPDPAYRRICLKGISMAMQRVYSPDRVKYPMKRAGERGEDKWERISWDQALTEISDKLKDTAAKHGPEACSWMSMTGNYGINAQLIASRISNTLGGTQIDNLGIMGDLASNVAFVPMLGVLQEGHGWEDLMGVRTLLLFGCNYAETSLNDWHFIADALEDGTKLVVVDPRFSRTAAKADWWIPIRPGTDAALMLGLMHLIVKNGWQDEEYIKKYTNEPFLVRSDNGKIVTEADMGGAGKDAMVWDQATNAAAPFKVAANPALTGSFMVNIGGQQIAVRPAHQLFLDEVAQWTPEKASEVCEVPVADIEKLAEMYARQTPAALRITQGTQRYWQGHLAFRAAITMGAITGNIGKRHAGVSWAGGTLFKLIGALPPSWAQPNPNVKGKKLPGTQLYDIIPSGKPYPIKTLWLLSYGMGTQAPLRERLIKEVFPALDLIVVSEQIMTDVCKYADYVLPVTSWYEEECDIVGAWSNLWMQFRKQAIKPMWEAKTDWDCMKALAEKMGQGEYWKMTQQESAEYIVKNATDPVISGTDLEALRKDGVVWANQPKDFIPFEDKKFPTPSGRIEIYQEVWLPWQEQVPVYKEPFESNRTPLAKKYPLTFMNVRSVYTAHAQHVTLPWILEVNPEPRLEMNPKDAGDRGMADGDWVEVFNDRGAFKVKLQVTEGIKPGCLDIRQGWWPKQFRDNTHYASLLHMELNPAQDAVIETNFAPYDNLVEVRKA